MPGELYLRNTRDPKLHPVISVYVEVKRANPQKEDLHIFLVHVPQYALVIDLITACETYFDLHSPRLYNNLGEETNRGIKLDKFQTGSTYILIENGVKILPAEVEITKVDLDVERDNGEEAEVGTSFCLVDPTKTNRNAKLSLGPRKRKKVQRRKGIVEKGNHEGRE